MVQAADLGWIRHMVACGQARRASNGAPFRAGHGASSWFGCSIGRFDMRTGCMRAGCGLIPGKATARTEHSMVQAADLGWIRHMVACGLRLGRARIEWRFIPDPERFDMRTGCMRAGCGLIPGKTTTRTEHSMAQAADLGWIRHMVACG